MLRLLSYLWALPVTLIGVLIAGIAWLFGGRVRVRAGVLEASGGLLKRLLRGGAAATLGHVILARDEICLDRSRVHERFHVGQFEQWGPLLLPTYWLIASWLRVRGFDPYLDHPLEPPISDD